MQGINAVIRNPAFAPSFFFTPVLIFVTAALAYGSCLPWRCFVAAGSLYVLGALLLTFWVNVPMNEALAQITIPTDSAVASSIWQAYSAPWQFWNTLRTVVSGFALIITGLGILSLSAERA